MNRLFLPHYDLQMTLLGGQAFNFDYENGFFYGFTTDKVIKLKKDNDYLFWQTYPKTDDHKFLKQYLRVEVNYSQILKKIQKDKYVKLAIKKYPYIRLLNQDFEQTLFSFLVSANNNIKSIRTIIRAMNRKFGKKINVGNKTICLFPNAEVIKNAKLEDLLECKLGFRAKFLKGAAKYIIETNLTNKIKNLGEQEARSSLKEIKGIGDKIADCILVFSLGFDNVTPLDVWGKRILTQFYKVSSKKKYEEMRKWIDNYFEGYAGWAGQYLYEYIRHL